MSAKFYTLLTDIGAAKLANAAALGVPLKITQMAVGDGGGVLPTPSAQQTALVAEKRRASLNMLYIDPQNSSQIIAEQVIPETEGGWWIREVGLFDETGAMIAVGNCPESYKPQLAEGSGRTQTVRMVLITSTTDNITLKIDPSVVLATRKYVDDKVLELRVYVDDLMAAHIAAADPHKQYAPKASPLFTGTPKAPTAPAGNSTTQLATTEFVQAAMIALVNGAPATLDTLKEIAAAINNDPNFSNTISTALGLKAPLKDPVFTGSVEISSGAPLLKLSESDTGKKYFIVVDGGDFRLNEDTTSGSAAIMSFSSTTKKVSFIGQLVPGDYANFDAKYQAKGDYQALDETLTALAGLQTSRNKLPYFTGTDTAGLTDLTTIGRDIIGKESTEEILRYLGMIDGVSEKAVGRLIGKRIFTSSDVYTPAPGTKFIIAELQGGGGGGGGVGTRAASGSMSIGASGGGGGYGKFLITNLASTYAITVGAGGNGGSASSSNNTTTTGSNGGNTTLGSVATATGGNGATTGVSAAPGLTMVAGRAAGGSASGTGLIQVVLGGNSKYGFTLTASAGSSGAGGSSFYGSGGQEALSQLDNTPQAGSQGGAYGSGGSGAISSGTGAGAAGGKGADGVVVIWEYA